MEMNMTPSAVTVSHAVSGRFAADRPESEQIALVWNDNYSQSSAVADASITWIWMENNAPRQYDANCKYLKGCDADGSGTFPFTGKGERYGEPRVLQIQVEKLRLERAGRARGAACGSLLGEELPYENGVGGVTSPLGTSGKARPARTWAYRWEQPARSPPWRARARLGIKPLGASPWI